MGAVVVDLILLLGCARCLVRLVCESVSSNWWVQARVYLIGVGNSAWNAGGRDDIYAFSHRSPLVREGASRGC